MFASIDQRTLLVVLKKHITDEKVHDLVVIIMRSFERGLPLGNLTSQLFINVYLHELDWFCKHELNVKNYLRYADDIVIVASSKYEIEVTYKRISDFLLSELSLVTHKKSVTAVSQGVDVLGVVFFPK